MKFQVNLFSKILVCFFLFFFVFLFFCFKSFKIFSLIDRERDFFGKSTNDFNTSSRQTSSNYVTSSSTAKNDLHSNLVQRQTSNQLNSWLDDINSPLVSDTSDGKLLKLRFDVTQYLPEEIVVKTVDNRLQVSV